MGQPIFVTNNKTIDWTESVVFGCRARLECVISWVKFPVLSNQGVWYFHLLHHR